MKSFKKNVVLAMFVAMLLVVVSAGLAVAEDTITGTIAEKGDTFVLDAADGSYALEGGDMTPEMVGKTVKVTGTVAETDAGKVISVVSLEEVKE